MHVNCLVVYKMEQCISLFFLCMLGRAIRHIGDYASILLVDVRYTTSPSSSAPSRQASKLPSWIKECLFNVTGNFGEVQRLLHQFFKVKAGQKAFVADNKKTKNDF